MCAADETLSIAPRIILEALDTLGGDLKKLEMFMTNPESCSKTVFDLKLRNPDDPDFKYNLLLALNSLSEYPIDDKIPQYLKLHPILERWSSQPEKDMIEACMQHVCRRIYNAITYNIELLTKNADGRFVTKEDKKKFDFGISIFPFVSFFNHSCCSNTEDVRVDNKFVVTVSHPIKKGEQVFINYG